MLTEQREAGKFEAVAVTRLEATGSEFSHDTQGILREGKGPGGWNQQRFQTMVLVIYSEHRTAGGLGEMKKQNFGLGCTVLSRDAPRMMTDPPISEADGRYLLLSGLCICCSLSLECTFPAFLGFYSLSPSLSFSSSRKTSLALLPLPTPSKLG